MYSVGKRSFRLWRPAKVYHIRQIIQYLGIVRYKLDTAGTVFVDQAEREAQGLSPRDWSRPRQWHEYVENSPDRLSDVERMLDDSINALCQLRTSVQQQRRVALAEIDRRAREARNTAAQDLEPAS